MNTLFKVLKYTAYTIEIFFVYILQLLPGTIPQILGGRPVMMIPAVLTIAFFEGDAAGIAVGVAGGLLIDMGTGGTIGFFGIMLAISCYIVGMLTQSSLRLNLFSAVLLTLPVIPVVFLLNWLFTYVMAGYGSSGYALLSHTLPSMIYTMLFIPVFYGINKVFSTHIVRR